MTGIPALATRVAKARWPGECPDCGKTWRVGDQIALCGYWRCIRCQLAHLHNTDNRNEERS
jgi:predicted  nucleic acid-binding Zn ribbon protein